MFFKNKKTARHKVYYFLDTFSEGAGFEQSPGKAGPVLCSASEPGKLV